MNHKHKLQFAALARGLTGRFVFSKKLPEDLGGASIGVTSRTNVRFLMPGFDRSARELMDVARNYLSLGDCVWDIGSSLGFFSVSAAHRVGLEGRVFGLEADTNHARIQFGTLTRLPQSYGPVSLLCAAVADRRAILDFAIPKRGHARSHLAEVDNTGAGET